MRTRSTQICLLLACMVGLLAACAPAAGALPGAGSTTPSPASPTDAPPGQSTAAAVPRPGTLTVFAAASLTEAFTEVATA